jgi:SAM-dependent methyltransferase
MTKQSQRGGCPLCQEWQVEVLCRPPGYPDDLCCCPRCGFVFVDTPLLQSHYDEMYRDRSAYNGQVPEWDRERHAGTAEIVRRYVHEGALTLDVGCGNGGLVHALRDVRLAARGMDPSPACVARLPDEWGIQGSLFDLPEGIGKWRCVVLSHVLEHVRDLRGAVRAVRALLVPDGIVYAEVPDVARYAERFDGPYQQISEEHIQAFSASTLCQLFVRGGFVVLEVGWRTFKSPPPFDAAATFCVAKASRSHEFCHASKPAMQEYLIRSAAEWERIAAKLAAIEGPVIVWGVGQLARKLEHLLHGRTVVPYDSNPRGDYCGLRVERPANDDGEPWFVESTWPIIVTSILHEQEIVAEIKRLGLKNKIITLS